MKSEADIDVQIERYLHGEMAGQELADFEQRVQLDPVFAQRVNQYLVLHDALQLHSSRTRLRNKLDRFHEELQHERVVLPASAAAAAAATGWRVHLNRHMPTLAIAASVAAVSIFGTLWVTTGLRSNQRPHTAQYRELRKEVDRIKRTQTAIIKDINSKTGEHVEVAPVRFSGTGFALTSDGYLVTSYHVVRDADSLLVENSQGQTYRAQIIYKDTAHDLAIVRVSDPNFDSFGKLPYSFRQQQSDLGEKVFTLGYPREDVVYGEGSVSATTGFEGDSDAYQISIPVNPGNSGGPLLDDRGNLIGIISGTQTEAQGTAFAIKSTYLLNLINTLPKDTLLAPVKLSKNNNLAGQPRTQQLRKLRDYVFNIKVYNQQ